MTSAQRQRKAKSPDGKVIKDVIEAMGTGWLGIIIAPNTMTIVVDSLQGLTPGHRPIDWAE
jgi:aspartate/glutamate racemase